VKQEDVYCFCVKSEWWQPAPGAQLAARWAVTPSCDSEPFQIACEITLLCTILNRAETPQKTSVTNLSQLCWTHRHGPSTNNNAKYAFLLHIFYFLPASAHYTLELQTRQCHFPLLYALCSQATLLCTAQRTLPGSRCRVRSDVKVTNRY
jgi:hypothetical protein